MRSCLRTLVWLVSLISPARNISSTTVYTLKCRQRQGIRGRIREDWNGSANPTDHTACCWTWNPSAIIFIPTPERLELPGKLAETVSCGHYSTLCHQNVEIGMTGKKPSFSVSRTRENWMAELVKEQLGIDLWNLNYSVRKTLILSYFWV